jgi:uncharacterized lipoprotein YmbA
MIASTGERPLTLNRSARRGAKGLVLPLLLVLAGCGFLKRNPNQFYTLEVIKPAAATPRAAGGAPLGIDGVELPPGLDRREIIVRGADRRFEVRGTQLWAAPLEDMVIHTLAFDLANRLPEGMVVLPGQPRPQAIRSITVVFEDLAAGQDRVLVLDARVTAAGATRHERITVQLSSLESAEIVAAMSQALAQLADRIAAAV